MRSKFLSYLFGSVLIGIFGFNVLNADAYVSVKGYTRKDGTYVAPHVRSEPNGLKYDNYSYKPSQGLYNPSYGTKGATWDTPTYITDPNYYVGKSIYDSNHLGTGYSNYPTTPSCPLFSSYDSVSSSCKCNYGYVVSGSICVSGSSACYSKYGYGSEFDSLGNSCKCSYGYRWNDTQTSCVSNLSYCTDKFGYGAEYSSLNKNCQCSTGYEFDGTKCTYKTNVVPAPTPILCPENSSLLNGSCYCNTGYEINTTKDGCIIRNTCSEGYVLKGNSCITYTQDCTNVYGQNTYGQKGESDGTSLCYCALGYKWNDGKTSCISDETVKIGSGNIEENLDNSSVVVKYIKPTVSTLRVRSLASQTGKVVGSIQSSSKYKVVTENNGWTQIRFGKDSSLKGWVMNKYIMEVK